MLSNRIEDLVAQYLKRKVGLAQFAVRFASLYFQARKDRSESSANTLCNAIVLPYAELSRGDRSEQSFREELTQIARPFAQEMAQVIYIDSYSLADPYAVTKPQDVDLGPGPIRKPPLEAIGRVVDVQLIYGHG